MHSLGTGQFLLHFGILPVCGARHLSSGSKSPQYLSTAAQLYALPLSAIGGGRARFPLAGTRRSCSNPSWFPHQKSKPQKWLAFLMAEKDYASQIASFFSHYQLLLKWYFIGVERLKICYTLTMYHFNKKGVSVSLCNIKSITPNITPTNRLHIRSRTP